MVFLTILGSVLLGTHNISYSKMLPPPGWVLIYNSYTVMGTPIPPGSHSGWQSFNVAADVATFKLKFQFKGDIITGGGGSGGPNAYAIVQVKNPSGAVVLSRQYSTPNLWEWYTFEETLSNPIAGGTFTFDVYASPDCWDGLGTWVYKANYAYREIDVD